MAKISLELLEAIYKEHIETGKSISKLSVEHNIERRTLSSLLKKEGFITLTKGEMNDKNSIRNHNADFFDKIDTQAKAYCLGLLLSDGNVTYNKDRRAYQIGLELQDKEKEVVQYFAEQFNLKATYRIREESRKMWIARINSRYMAETVV